MFQIKVVETTYEQKCKPFSRKYQKEKKKGIDAMGLIFFPQADCSVRYLAPKPEMNLQRVFVFDLLSQSGHQLAHSAKF